MANFLSFLLGHEVIKTLMAKAAESVGGKAVEEVGKKLPTFLSLSYEDERIWAGLMTALKHEDVVVLMGVLNSLKDHERNSFRHVVVGIQKERVSETKIVSEHKNKKGKVVTTEKEVKTTYKEGAIEFLNFLVEYIKQQGIEKSIDFLRTGNIISESKYLKKWKEEIKWFETTAIPFFKNTAKTVLGEENLSEITTKKVMERIGELDDQLAEKIKQKPLYKGFIKEAFGWMLPKKGGKNDF